MHGLGCGPACSSCGFASGRWAGRVGLQAGSIAWCPFGPPVLAHLGRCGVDCPTVLMGDCNEWGVRHASGGGALGEFHAPWRVLDSGRSFPSRRPVARLDRIVISPHWDLTQTGVHHSALAARGSDHLPIFARLALHKI